MEIVNFKVSTRRSAIFSKVFVLTVEYARSGIMRKYEFYSKKELKAQINKEMGVLSV
jgi:hypothetical protein